MTYGDVELILTDWLSTRLNVRTCTELPATLPAQVVQVVRFGGGRPSFPFDDASVDIDCYAASRQAARDLAEAVSVALMYSLPGSVVGQVKVLSADCITAPAWAPYDNTNVRRFTASYVVRTHNPITTP